MKVLLRVDKVNKIQKKKDLNDGEFAYFIGVSRSQLWRAKMSPSDKRFSLGQDFIAKMLKAFPDCTFEDLFFLNDVSHARDKNKTTA
jgi:hypothetical protein